MSGTCTQNANKNGYTKGACGGTFTGALLSTYTSGSCADRATQDLLLIVGVCSPANTTMNGTLYNSWNYACSGTSLVRNLYRSTDCSGAVGSSNSAGSSTCTAVGGVHVMYGTCGTYNAGTAPSTSPRTSPKTSPKTSPRLRKSKNGNAVTASGNSSNDE